MLAGSGGIIDPHRGPRFWDPILFWLVATAVGATFWTYMVALDVYDWWRARLGLTLIVAALAFGVFLFATTGRLWVAFGGAAWLVLAWGSWAMCRLADPPTPEPPGDATYPRLKNSQRGH